MLEGEVKAEDGIPTLGKLFHKYIHTHVKGQVCINQEATGVAVVTTESLAPNRITIDFPVTAQSGIVGQPSFVS